MIQSLLRVKPRKRIGKAGAREVRKEGNIPAILYGQGAEPLPLTVRPDELKQALSNSAGANTVLELEIEGSDETQKRLSILKEIQRDPIKNKVTHIDFFAISMEKKIRVDIPVNTHGRSEGERKGGKVEKLMRSIAVECLPKDIPDSIDIDVSGLDLGGYVDVAGLGLAEGVKSLVDDKEKVVIVSSRSSDATDDEAETEEEDSEQ